MVNKALSRQDFTKAHRVTGITAAWALFFLGMIYAVTLVLGLLSLKSSQDPIGDPFLSILEVCIVLMAPFLVMVMVAIHGYASSDVKACSLIALAFMMLTAGITSSVHFTIVTVRPQMEADGFPWTSHFVSFTWPSVAYALDILAWDLFFALSMLFAAFIFKAGRLEKTIRILMIVSGVLSLAGFIGVALADMQIRMIGVVGYAAMPPIVFLLIGMVFRK